MINNMASSVNSITLGVPQGFLGPLFMSYIDNIKSVAIYDPSYLLMISV